MRTARESRGFQARHLGHARVLAASAGTLFIRSYERGERVHLAMLSRGFTGRMPAMTGRGRRPRQTGRLRRCCWPWPPVRRRVEDRRDERGSGGRRAVAGGRGARVRLSRRPPGALRRRLCHWPGRAGGPPRAQRSRQDHAGPSPQRHPHRRARVGACRWARPCEPDTVREIRRRVGIVFQDPDDQLFMPTRARGRRVRSRQPRGAWRRARCSDRGRAGPGGHGRVRRPAAAPPQLRAAPPRRGGHGARDAARDPGARRALVEPRPGQPS